MTKDRAIEIWLRFGQPRLEAEMRAKRPQAWCDQVLLENAQDVIEGLVALGLLKLEPDPPQTF